VKRALFCWLGCAAGVLGAALACAATDHPVPASAARIAPAGEAIYRRGVLPSGAPLVGQREAGVTVEGMDAACIRCHRRSGLGVMEGRGSSIPPISGLYLFKPRSHDDNDLPFVESMRAERDPYTEATLARAIREGIAANGRPLGYLMPRFALDDATMTELIAYLKVLTPRRVPGVTDTELHFATVITPDADPVKRAAMLDVLTQYFSDKNAAYRNTAPRLKSGRPVMFRVTRRWQLHVWELSGAADTWEAQLGAHLAKEPVFALISGIGGRSWAPVHRFCERAGLPCLMPNVDLPDAAPDDFYTVYFSRGVLLEAELIAHDLAARGVKAQRIGLLFRTGDIGEQAAAAFTAAMGASGTTVVSRHLPAKGGDLRGALDGRGPVDAWVLWLRPSDLAVLAQRPPPAGLLYISGLMSELEQAPLPESWRPATRMPYLFDLPDQRRVRLDYQLGWFAARKITVSSLRIQSDTFLACGLLAETLSHMVDAFQRDYLVERLDDNIEHRILTGYYPRLSLGIGQNFGSKGGYLVHFAEPKGAKLARDSEWIVP
jgi:hypothetical protein